MSEKLTVVVRIRARAGMEDQVRLELLDLLDPTREEEGCINFDLHQAEEDPRLFLVHENWMSEEALARHFEKPYLRAWVAKAEELLAEPMDLTRWHRIG
ncbi:MAG: putative quinol monooxygenase [Gemmatimonadota bacterium]